MAARGSTVLGEEAEHPALEASIPSASRCQGPQRLASLGTPPTVQRKEYLVVTLEWPGVELEQPTVEVPQPVGEELAPLGSALLEEVFRLEMLVSASLEEVSRLEMLVSASLEEVFRLEARCLIPPDFPPGSSPFPPMIRLEGHCRLARWRVRLGH